MTDDNNLPSQRRRSLLERQWDMIDVDRILLRNPEVAMLLKSLGSPGSITEVVALPGMGKTTLLKVTAEQYRKKFGGMIEYVSGAAGFALAIAGGWIASNFVALKPTPS